jgi:hypothetical protein
MPSSACRGRVRPWTRLTLLALRALTRGIRVLLVALAAGMGASPRPPQMFRHEDPAAQVAEEDSVN